MKKFAMKRHLSRFALVGGMLLSLDGLAETASLPWTIISVSKDEKMTTETDPRRVDLTYPPPGQQAPVLKAGERNTGIEITEQEFLERQSKPHFIHYFPAVEYVPETRNVAGNGAATGAAAGGASAVGTSAGGQRSQPTSKSVLPQAGGHGH